MDDGSAPDGFSVRVVVFWVDGLWMDVSWLVIFLVDWDCYLTVTPGPSLQLAWSRFSQLDATSASNFHAHRNSVGWVPARVDDGAAPDGFSVPVVVFWVVWLILPLITTITDCMKA